MDAVVSDTIWYAFDHQMNNTHFRRLDRKPGIVRQDRLPRLGVMFYFTNNSFLSKIACFTVDFSLYIYCDLNYITSFKKAYKYMAPSQVRGQ